MVSMERVWKEFGKNTQAGKMLYEIYGVRYKAEQHINYPKIVKKKTILILKKQIAIRIMQSKALILRRINELQLLRKLVILTLRKKITTNCIR